MRIIEWNKDFALGIEALDRDHQQIIMFINLAQDAVELGRTDLAYGLVRDMAKKCREHFQFEGQLLLCARYPYLDKYVDANNKAIATLQEIDAMLRSAMNIMEIGEALATLAETFAQRLAADLQFKQFVAQVAAE